MPLSFIKACILAILLIASPQRALAYSDAEIIDGFNRTVFGSEFSSSTFGQSYLRKFRKPVRLFIEPGGSKAQRLQIRRFVASLPKLIKGLDISLVGNRKGANFFVHPVTRANYVKTARERVFRSSRAVVNGRCMVRAVFSRSGISKSDAVIVTDEGNDLFSRCMTEEILQGLGPLNDDPTLRHSMFNDTSTHTSFRRFDRLIMNVLYDDALRPGMSQRRVKSLLAGITRRVQKRITGR